MVETHEVSNRVAPRPATPENADDAFGEVTEEITALRAIVEAYSHGGGEEYFQALVRNLAGAVDAHYAFVAEFSSPESYEEAPLAYVQEDLQSRFIRANRAAQRILGIKPEEVPGFVGLSLVPDRPDAQRAAHRWPGNVRELENILERAVIL
jgi:PAS domain-containing protein